MKFGRPRGTKDFLPDEMRVRQHMLRKIREAFELHGFEEMDTPAIELWEVLSAKGGEEVERQIYKFQDKGGRWIGLRFDLTVPLARVVASNPNLVKPFKRYCISKVWRYEEPQSGRLREFLQADIDIVGSARMEADMECISTAVDALKSLGLEEFEVRVNNRKILEGMMDTLSISPEVSINVFRTLDKIEKIGEDNVSKELEKIGLKTELIEKILEFTHYQGSEALEYAEQRFGSSKSIKEGIQELRRMIELSEPYGLENLLVVDFSLVRGLDYYTGPVFEIKVKEAQIGSVAGGGRYDSLIEKFGGGPTPATGISLGIERLYEVLNERIRSVISPSKTAVFIANTSPDLLPEAIRLRERLLKLGIVAETDLMGRKLGRQLEYADVKKIPYVLIVGPEELRTGIFKLREMANKKEFSVTLEEVTKTLGR
ncbi:MAG: histidine--tRNA ligase [Candidatus Methanomethylicia archaeon]|jgi:histidyl-tRNA synthetase|nr:histidine--tRNA ligase [Candidatus Methanomethylicia archaeon]